MGKDENEGLDRRDFIKSAGMGLAGLALVVNQQLTVHASETLQRAMGSLRRYVIPLNHRWLYSEKNVPGSSGEQFDDSRFSRITIPHTNRMLPWHGFDD